MLYAARPGHGALVFGFSVGGRGLVFERQPYCHRWALIRLRPIAVKGCGEWGDDASGGGREPRRPLPGGLTGRAVVDPPA
jgi:hypothetical protein